MTNELASVYTTASPGRFGLVVGLGIALLAGSVNIRSFSNDNVPNVLVPISLLREGNIELSEFAPLTRTGKASMNYWAVQTDHGLYSRYSIWTGVITTPLFAPVAFLSTELPDEAFLLRFSRLPALAMTAVFAGTLAVTLRRFMPGAWAAGLALFTVLGTTLWHQLASQLSNQLLPVVCAVGILAFIAQPVMTWRGAAAVGLLAGLMIGTRPASLLIALAPLGVFLGRRWRKWLVPMIAAATVFPMLTLAYNTIAFGHPLTTGYGSEPNERFEAVMWQGLTGLLLSPTCGLLVYSPFLLFSCIAGWKCIRGAGVRENVITGRWVILGIVGQLVLFSKWWAWNGALTYGGARMLAETIPGWVLLLALQWQGVMNSGRAHRWIIGLGVLSILSFTVGVVVYDAIAPFNPAKPDWDWSRDFIVLYSHRFGIYPLVANASVKVAILLGTFAAIVVLAPRFLKTQGMELSGVRRTEFSGA